MLKITHSQARVCNAHVHQRLQVLLEEVRVPDLRHGVCPKMGVVKKYSETETYFF